MKEGVDEMIKCLANEPSVGLYFVQHHAQASMPNLLSVKVVLFSQFSNFTIDLFLLISKRGNKGIQLADIKVIN